MYRKSPARHENCMGQQSGFHTNRAQWSEQTSLCMRVPFKLLISLMVEMVQMVALFFKEQSCGLCFEKAAAARAAPGTARRLKPVQLFMPVN